MVTHTIRTIYELLKIRNKIRSENKVVFIIIFTNMVILWISWFNLSFTDPNKINLNPAVKYLGAVIFLSGLILFILSLAKIKRFENYHGDLITNGIYRFLRHPMYLSFILWMIGSSLFNQSGVALIMTIIFTANIFVWKKLEEIQLLKSFPNYKEYMKRTYF
jgi:protein-S-isoprenylcysteine O-methyltransferase Ste14